MLGAVLWRGASGEEQAESPLAAVQPAEATTLAGSMTTTSWETLSQEHPDPPLPECGPPETVR